jgi:hypothetical protein
MNADALFNVASLPITAKSRRLLMRRT